MTEISDAIREFVRGELSWLADFLHDKFGVDYKKGKQIIREILEVSV